MNPADDPARSAASPRLRIRPPLRPWRVVVGLGLLIGGTLSCWALMAEASERHDVVVLRRSVAAGEMLAAEDLDVVAIGTDDGVPSISAERFDDVVGQHARYGLAAGALLIDDNLQADPLVTPGRALVSVVAASGNVPVEITVGDDVALVLVDDQSCGASAVSMADATVTAGPRRSSGSSAGSGTAVVSLEIDDGLVAVVAMADRFVIARPNSPEAEAALATATADAAVDCDTGSSTIGPGADNNDADDDPMVQQPVPTGVTPMDPADSLVDPAP